MSCKQWGGGREITIFLTISFKNKFCINRKLSIKNRKFKITIRKYGKMFNKIWLKKAFPIKAQTHKSIRDFWNQASLRIAFRFIHISEQRRM